MKTSTRRKREMSAEDKKLLFRTLCMMLPYNVVLNCTEDDDEKTNFDCFLTPGILADIASENSMWNYKPYLRSFDRMANEEEGEYYGRTMTIDVVQTSKEVINWCCEHKFDVNELIGKGLAIEDPEGMYS